MSADVSNQAPSDFTPHDVAKPANSRDNESINPLLEESKGLKGPTGVKGSKIDAADVNDAVAQTSQHTSLSVSESTSVSTVYNQVERKIAELNPSSVAYRALARLGVNPSREKTLSATTDDRPALLANILATDASPELRRIAAWGLSEYSETRIATDALVRALRTDADGSVREMAAWALGNGDDHSTAATTALTAALKGDSKEGVRVTAAWALGNGGGRDAAGALTSVLNDPNPAVRVRAIWALGNIDTKNAPAALITMLKDRDPQVRHITAWALYQIEDPDAVPALSAALSAESSKELQVAYIRALAALGEKSVDAIRGLLTSSDPRIKSMAVRALAGGNAAGPWPWPWPEPRPYP